MAKVLFICLMLLGNVMAFSQQAVGSFELSAMKTQVEEFNFDGKFAHRMNGDSVNNYYLINLSKLPSRFERVYFMNLSFGCGELINIDPDIAGRSLFFMSKKSYQESEILRQLNHLCDSTVNTSALWALEEKAEWLKSNDKYK